MLVQYSASCPPPCPTWEYSRSIFQIMHAVCIITTDQGYKRPQNPICSRFVTLLTSKGCTSKDVARAVVQAAEASMLAIVEAAQTSLPELHETQAASNAADSRYWRRQQSDRTTKPLFPPRGGRAQGSAEAAPASFTKNDPVGRPRTQVHTRFHGYIGSSASI